MPVYHFTLHAYGSWHPDHSEGWHQHGQNSPLRPHAKLAVHRRDNQRWPTATFEERFHESLSAMVIDICARREWRCHGGAINESHIHIVGSWRDSTDAADVQSTFKRLLGLKLAQVTGIGGRRWFSDGGKPKAVRGKAHLDYLLTEYFPSQGGYWWAEARARK